MCVCVCVWGGWVSVCVWVCVGGGGAILYAGVDLIASTGGTLNTEHVNHAVVYTQHSQWSIA